MTTNQTTQSQDNNSQQWIYGFHAVRSALRNEAENLDEIWLSRHLPEQKKSPIIQLAKDKQIPIKMADMKKLDSFVPDQNHQGLLAKSTKSNAPRYHESDLPDLLAEANSDRPKLLLILDGVTDPHNLGACLRTANAAGAIAVITPKDNAAGLSSVVRKVASGAAETTPLINVTNLARTLEQLKTLGFWIVGTSDQAKADLYEHDLTGHLALVMGAEGKGMRANTQKHCDMLVKLPMLGKVESLNVSVATGVCLYEIRRQQK